MSRLLVDYRRLLRHAKSLPSRDLFVNYIRRAFRQDDGSPSLPDSYLRMVSSVKELKHLRSLDSGERLDPREKIKATAARVGFELPQVSDRFGCMKY